MSRSCPARDVVFPREEIRGRQGIAPSAVSSRPSVARTRPTPKTCRAASGSGPAGRFLAVQTERKALGAAARLDELVQLRAVGRVAVGAEIDFEPRAAGIDHDVTTNDHRVTGEALCFLGCDGDQAGDGLGKRALGVLVEGRRKVERLGIRERAKARVAVIVVL